MWLLCCGMMRSASTLQYNIAAKILEARAKVHRVGWIPPDRAPGVFAQAVDNENEWFIGKLHHYDDYVEAFRRRFHPKTIYIYRDIRDVTVSLMHLRSWPFDEPELEAWVNLALNSDQAWRQVPDIMISRYEEVMIEGGLVAEVEKIARYLDIQLDPAEIERIAASVTLSEHRHYIEQFDYAHHGQTEMDTSLDPTSLLHHNHIYSGAVGQWKSALTPEQIALVEAWAQGWLEARGYTVESHSEIEWWQQLQALWEDRKAKIIELRGHVNLLEARVQALEQELNQAHAHNERRQAENQNLRSEISALTQQIEYDEMRFEQIRGRKIAWLMRKFGRPVA